MCIGYENHDFYADLDQDFFLYMELSDMYNPIKNHVIEIKYYSQFSPVVIHKTIESSSSH